MPAVRCHVEKKNRKFIALSHITGLSGYTVLERKTYEQYTRLDVVTTI